MKNPNRDIFSSDMAFISFGAAMLTGIGLVMLVLGISCKLTGGGGICELELVGFPRLERELGLLSPDFISINLPLGMLIIGIGLQLFTRMGWVVSLIILLFFWMLFGTAIAAHWPNLKFEGFDYVFLQSAILQICFLLLVFGSILYLFSPNVRDIYWKKR